jgi:hypothetical protein
MLGSHKNVEAEQLPSRHDDTIELSQSQVCYHGDISTVVINTLTPKHLLQERVLQAALRGVCLFFTGSAGSGKSFLLSHIIDALREKHGVCHCFLMDFLTIFHISTIVLRVFDDC